MLRIAICDDEKIIRGYLAELIESQMEAEIVQFQDGTALLQSREEFDILLLDICMEHAENRKENNGMEIARKIRESSQVLIIFITALKEYAYQAFDVEAFHYLLKPIDELKFKEVLHKAVRQAERKKQREPLKVKIGGNYSSIPVEDILYAENSGRKIVLHTKKGSIVFYERMDSLENRLSSAFIRTHRGYLVHMQEIAAYDHSSITLKNGEMVFLSKQKYTKFVDTYMEYLKDH